METTAQLVSRSPGKRRYRTVEEKRRIVEETLSSEVSVAVMARRHGVNANQLFQWRKLYQAGLLGPSSEAEAGCVRLLPVTVVKQPEQQVREATPAEPSTGAIHIEFPGRWFRQLDLAPFDGLNWPHLKGCDLSFRVGLGGRSP